jgi:hypothetical protein
MYTRRFDMDDTGRARPSDLFGPLAPRRRGDRGWTELDRIRRRYDRLVRKVACGEASGRELEEARRLQDTIVAREREAREKWAKSFGS